MLPFLPRFGVFACEISSFGPEIDVVWPHPQFFCPSLQAPSSVTASLALAGTAVAALSAGSRKVSEAMGFHSCLDAGAVFLVEFTVGGEYRWD